MVKEQQKLTAEKIAKSCAKILDDKKAENILVLKVSEISIIADYFVICTANSQPHIRALSEWARRKIREDYQIRPISISGKAESQWIILDYGNVVLHILSKEIREKYQLEKLWNNAQKLEQALSKKPRSKSTRKVLN